MSDQTVAELAATVREALPKVDNYWRETPSQNALDALVARCEQLERELGERHDWGWAWKDRAEVAERRVAELEAAVFHHPEERR